MGSVAPFLAGLVFAVGLGIAGMTQPAKIIGFLDVTGRWDPSLAFVMLGAIAVYAPLSRLIGRRGRPLFAEGFVLPTRRDLDPKLVVGAGLFGIGWGLGGFCPGPAIVAVLSGSPEVLVFLVGMLAGMVAFEATASAAARSSRSGGLTAPADATDG